MDADQPASPDAVDLAYYARHLDAISALQRVKGYKRRTLELLRVTPGHRVLDVGVGDGVRALAELVGPTGEAIGLDASEAMVAEARRRADAAGSAARFETVDAGRLPYPEGQFDGCRADRVLQHLPEPAQAVAEMTRVVRPGGRVALAEPDWETYIVDAPHPERPLRPLPDRLGRPPAAAPACGRGTGGGGGAGTDRRLHPARGSRHGGHPAWQCDAGSEGWRGIPQ
jgi:SAM-dependent methyltransferase